jgi:hypothetical protein
MTAQDNLSGIQFEHFHSTLGGAVDATHEGRDVGHLDYRPVDGVNTIGLVTVAENYQHRGIATSMYKQTMEKTGLPLHHAGERTDAGDAWARHAGGPTPHREKVPDYAVGKDEL